MDHKEDQEDNSFFDLNERTLNIQPVPMPMIEIRDLDCSSIFDFHNRKDSFKIMPQKIPSPQTKLSPAKGVNSPVNKRIQSSAKRSILSKYINKSNKKSVTES